MLVSLTPSQRNGANETSTSLNEHHIDLDSFSLHLKGKKIKADKIQSKLLYETLSNQISSEPMAMKKYNEMFNTESFQLDWERKEFTHSLESNAGHKIKRVSIQNS